MNDVLRNQTVITTLDLTHQELAQLVSTLILSPESLGALDECDLYSDFLSDITEVIGKYCGGTINKINGVKDGQPIITVESDTSLPSLDQNVWAQSTNDSWAFCNE